MTQPHPAVEENRDASSEKVAREVRVSQLRKEGGDSAFCWQGTGRGCGSSPQTTLNTQLPQHRVGCEMFAEPRANSWAANP